MDSLQVLQDKAATEVGPQGSVFFLNWSTFQSELDEFITQKTIKCNAAFLRIIRSSWYNLINDNDRNNMIIRVVGHHSHNTRSKLGHYSIQ